MTRLTSIPSMFAAAVILVGSHNTSAQSYPVKPIRLVVAAATGGTPDILVHVPYKSGGLMVTALLSGEVQMMFLGLSPALPHVKAGRFRTIAVASAKRSPAAPDVPTFAEAGVAGVVVDNWLGVLTTAGSPRSTIEKLNVEIAKVVRAPEVAERITQQGVEVNTGSPAEFSAFLRAEIAKWNKVVKTAGIEPQ